MVHRNLHTSYSIFCNRWGNLTPCRYCLFDWRCICLYCLFCLGFRLFVIEFVLPNGEYSNKIFRNKFTVFKAYSMNACSESRIIGSTIPWSIRYMIVSIDSVLRIWITSSAPNKLLTKSKRKGQYLLLSLSPMKLKKNIWFQNPWSKIFVFKLGWKTQFWWDWPLYNN